MKQEKISAFADGELAEAEADEVLAALRTDEGKQIWSAYHRIGDGIRSDELAFDMSNGFAERVMRELEQEPIHLLPLTDTAHAVSVPSVPLQGRSARAGNAWRRWGQGAAALAAAAAFAWMTIPHLLQDPKAGDAPQGTQLASSASHISTISATVPATKGKEQLVRDPGVDRYLTAHERFSPSFYGTAQYARSATFSADPDK